jgi:hypothetical protein
VTSPTNRFDCTGVRQPPMQNAGGKNWNWFKKRCAAYLPTSHGMLTGGRTKLVDDKTQNHYYNKRLMLMPDDNMPYTMTAWFSLPAHGFPSFLGLVILPRGRRRITTLYQPMHGYYANVVRTLYSVPSLNSYTASLYSDLIIQHVQLKPSRFQHFRPQPRPSPPILPRMTSLN